MPAKLLKPRVLVAAVIVVVAAFAVAYFTLFDTGSPSKLTLQTKGSTAAVPTGDLAGTWTVADGSVAGYRVREKLAQLPAPSDAVGRTGAITGQVTITDQGGAYQAGSANFTVDVSQLRSDQDKRDNKIRSIGLETAKFPQAAFAAAGPIAIPADAVQGKAVRVQADGDLTLHGVTKRVTIPLDVQRDGAQVKVVGSYQFGWSDFGMTAPSLPPFVSVTGNPTLEFELRLARQA
ncbi:MAG TPA: YceI family protein [Acidimicrobiia bacterium]|nr:YceI family protein [Acidimicrobiia bacterium]HZQ77392.1 YceI family protein [Acidimicrobiia bacterium]